MARTSSNYNRFQYNRINRCITKKTKSKNKKTQLLEQSMKSFGFLKSKPIMTIKNRNGKLTIKSGHNRFEMARKLKIPLWYEVEDQDVPLHLLEGSFDVWVNHHWLESYINDGRHPYIVVDEYRKRTGIGLTNCISMLAGESAGSHNHLDDFKAGIYELGDPNHANEVADIILHCKRCGTKFAAISVFVRAISKIVWVEQFDVKIFKKKIESHSHLIEKQACLAAYIDMFEKLYNHGGRSKIPLAFYADEVARKRKSTIYRNKKSDEI